MDEGCLTRISRLTVAALILFAVGGGTTVGSLTSWTERHYNVTIEGPDTVRWNLWLPSPDGAVETTSQGTVSIAGVVATPHGPLLNITGTGVAQLRFHSARLALGPDPLQSGGGFELRGREGTGANRTFALWRSSTDAARNVTIHGLALWNAWNLHASAECGSPSYSGSLVEGWNFMPMLFGDCVVGIWFFPGLLPTLFFLGGGQVLRTARRHRAPA